jgi:hypothetical protein
VGLATASVVKPLALTAGRQGDVVILCRAWSDELPSRMFLDAATTTYDRAPGETTEWEDILRDKGILPPKVRQTIAQYSLRLRGSAHAMRAHHTVL